MTTLDSVGLRGVEPLDISDKASCRDLASGKGDEITESTTVGARPYDPPRTTVGSWGAIEAGEEQWGHSLSYAVPGASRVLNGAAVEHGELSGKQERLEWSMKSASPSDAAWRTKPLPCMRGEERWSTVSHLPSRSGLPYLLLSGMLAVMLEGSDPGTPSESGREIENAVGGCCARRVERRTRVR